MKQTFSQWLASTVHLLKRKPTAVQLELMDMAYHAGYNAARRELSQQPTGGSKNDHS